MQFAGDLNVKKNTVMPVFLVSAETVFHLALSRVSKQSEVINNERLF